MKISVVIPAYNEERMISTCLVSLQRQTRPADEIIVVDNNSTDATAIIARRHGATVIEEAKQGIVPASYTGMNVARGDIIARCDADSILPPDWLATIENQLSKTPAAIAITGPGRFYDTSKLNNAFAQIWYMYAYFILVGSAIARWPLFGSNYAIHRHAWLSIADMIHSQRTDIHDDIDVTMHLPLDAKVLFSRDITVGISARALRMNNLKTRYERGMRSLTIHWPERSPTRCWRARLRNYR